MSVVRVAAVQLCSTDDIEANLAQVRRLVGRAAEQGAEFIALPENFGYLRREGLSSPCAQGVDGPFVGCLKELACEHDVWLLGGSFPEAIPQSDRVYNCSALVSSAGECVATYRKIHLFDVDLGRDGGSFRESDAIAAGDAVVDVTTPFGQVGLSICYDLRFPELYRELATRGVHFVTVPAAFAPGTGRDHWEVLLRARAIENQVFVIAPAQCGEHSADRASYGRSMIIDPWGLVLASAGDEPAVCVADCDLDHLERVRKSIPCLDNRRL
ncbi:MAG: carbon-nitrogen hydrolase family protein [Myxococcota bacterium]|jgi:predicted amidohydrolase|nr:carbon-nitrogen hydrolase family protein [Myxococcota bacterium]